MRYMNSKKVPQLFVATGATKFGESPKTSPYTMGWQPNYQNEGRIYARYILDNKPNAKIGVLFQNDDYGKDLMKGLKDGLGEKAKSLIVAEASYEVTEPTVDSQIVKLKAAGADLFLNVATPKFAAQAIRKVAEIGWTPLHIVNNVSASVGGVLKPAGLENAKNLLSVNYFKDPTDPTWNDDPGMKEWNAFLDKYYPDADRTNGSVVYGYLVAQTLVQVLKQCGDELTRDNVMKQAANLNMDLPLLLPGIKIKTSATDSRPAPTGRGRRASGTGRFSGRRCPSGINAGECSRTRRRPQAGVARRAGEPPAGRTAWRKP
jgi:branched-chain amino acid transport system substrate-binding protein